MFFSYLSHSHLHRVLYSCIHHNNTVVIIKPWMFFFFSKSNLYKFINPKTWTSIESEPIMPALLRYIVRFIKPWMFQCIFEHQYYLIFLLYIVHCVGLNVEVDRILEIACIITDGQLTKSVEVSIFFYLFQPSWNSLSFSRFSLWINCSNYDGIECVFKQ